MIRRILLVGPYRGDRLASIERYVACVQRALESSYEVTAISPRNVFGRFSRGRALKWAGYLDKFLLFPQQLRAQIVRRDALVHVCDQAAAVHTPLLNSVPHVLTCFDLIAIRAALGEFPEHRPRALGRRLQQSILNGIRHAEQIICISEATRQDLLRIAQMPDHRATTIPLALHQDFQPVPKAIADPVIARFMPGGAPFLLHVGGAQWYKNRAGVLRIFAELIRKRDAALNLVLIGAALNPAEKRIIERTQIGQKVHILSNINDRDLAAFYSSARLLLFPSLCEGFGWPVLEAQACGCPVAASNRAPLPEVGECAALYFDPTNIQGAAAAVAAMLEESDGVRSARIRQGFQNVARFQIDAMIEGYRSVYNRAIASFDGFAQRENAVLA